MFGRSTPQRAAVLTVALLLPLLGAGVAHAHRLDAQAFLLRGQRVQIESWFDDNSKPHGAKVQVWRANEQLLTEGQTDDQGVFVFTFSQPEILRVVVSAGAGHRKELTIPAADLAQSSPTEPGNPVAAPATPPTTARAVPLVAHDWETWTREVLLKVLVGISFLLALAAFVLSWHNARQLRELKQTRERIDAP